MKPTEIIKKINKLRYDMGSFLIKFNNFKTFEANFIQEKYYV